MAVELDHPFTTAKPIDESWAAILDLERLVPCVEGGSVLERTGPEAVKAEIKVKMGAMSMTFTGTVEVIEQDAAAHRAVHAASSRGRPAGRATPTRTSTFALADGGGTIHTAAQITGKAASMGEGVVDRRARRADQGLHRQAREHLSRWRGSRCARMRDGRGARGRRDRGPGGPGPARLPRQRRRTTTSAPSAATCSPTGDGRRATWGSGCASAAGAAARSTCPRRCRSR